MDLQIKNKIVLVTGSGQGVGKEIGMAFAMEGAHVIFHYLSSGAGAVQAVQEAQNLGVKSMAVKADITKADEVQKMVKDIEEEFGGIDILVNNAAYVKQQKFLESKPEEWVPQIEVTLNGNMLVTQAVLQVMMKQKSGSIINITGDSGRVGESGLTVTATARAGTIGFTKSLAKEMARYNIRVNCVSLGLVETPSFAKHVGGVSPEIMKKIISAYPIRRLGKPEDVPPPVLLLASPLSSWVTGQVFAINGGYSMV
ncbi:SDR family NAD(P)-dependent oxidoreductase [Bacillus sp. Marseille-P3661]|uniref:SDR family NAD(P)-dependent oxidoreductase n=1 Tax=Bacillus sp. Marseille-P3661 TaxID=1936234 RepID=UPI000C85B16A|nr:SDR family oxidoreductase [Bacillus sp. Marseille-P3661]